MTGMAVAQPASESLVDLGGFSIYTSVGPVTTLQRAKASIDTDYGPEAEKSAVLGQHVEPGDVAVDHRQRLGRAERDSSLVVGSDREHDGRRGRRAFGSHRGDAGGARPREAGQRATNSSTAC